jgi:hypothetical protein
MKNKFLFIISIFIILSSACSKDDNNANDNNNNRNINRDTSYISFKLDGREVKLDIASIGWIDSSGGTAVVLGTQKNGFEQFQIVFEGVDFNVGQSYSLVDDKIVRLAYYIPDKRMPFTNLIGFIADKQSSGSLKVTKKKLVPILGSYAFSATFSGIALDENEKTHQITDGFIYDSRSE